jgi:hypothetical protein
MSLLRGPWLCRPHVSPPQDGADIARRAAREVHDLGAQLVSLWL